jgi:hypothetical protein
MRRCASRTDRGRRSLALTDPTGELAPIIILGIRLGITATRIYLHRRAAAAAAARAAAAAAAAAAANRGPGPRADPGDCSAEYHAKLQDGVDRACKPSPRECIPGESCDEMRRKLATFTACADARKRLMDICYKRGDKRHQAEWKRRLQSAQTCVGLMPTCYE